jgi:hypothetical protein
MQLNLTYYHFEEKIDLKTTTEITIALLSPQNNWKCFADIRLLDQIGRQGYCPCTLYFRLAPWITLACSMYVSEYENDKQVFRLRTGWSSLIIP